MVGLPGLGAGAPPSVRRPVFAVGAGGGGGGGLGGALGGAASALGVSVPGATDPWQRSLVALAVDAAAAPSVDVAELWIAADSEAPSVAVGDALAVSLGYEDEGGPAAAFTGTVETVRRAVAGATRVTLANAGALLSRARVNQSYTQQSAGDIVSDLAGRVGVDTGTVESGIDLPFFVIDDHRSVYAHMTALARRCGYLLTVGADGTLGFAPPAGGAAVQTFTYGVDLLAFELSERTAALGAISAVGEGAAGSEGQDAWSWLVQDASGASGSAGSGDPERLRVDRALRSAASAQAVAGAVADAAARERSGGRLLVPGAAAVAVGSTIAVADAPAGPLNGDWLVLGVRHRFDKQAGFRTVLEVAGAGGGAAGALGGLV